ncbi:MAG: hypothetical protein ACK4Z8_06965 [Novosphingobium sp.]
MKRIAVVTVVAIVAVALLAVIWIRGGTQPMEWVEQPVDAGHVAGATQ